jgi:hypothetical protein
MTTAAAPTTAPAGDVPTITLTVPITTNEFYVFVGVIEFVLLVCAFNLMRGPSAELVA